MPTKTLLSFTGGMETTYIAWKLLTETDDEVTLLYLRKADDVVMRQMDGYPEVWQKAQGVIQELALIRPFNVVVKDITQEEITDDTNHYYTFLISYAAPFLNNGTYDRVVTGRGADQAGQKILSDVEGSPSAIAGQRLFNQLVTQGQLWNPLVDNAFGHPGTKAHVYSRLPSNLLSKTFSCVIPVVNENDELEPCQTCFKCVYINKMKQMFAAGATPDEIDLWRETKAYEYGGGQVMAPLRFWIFTELGVVPAAFTGHKRFNTKQEIINHLKTHKHYSTKGRPNTGVWEGLV